jgi:hypothetical protein
VAGEPDIDLGSDDAAGDAAGDHEHGEPPIDQAR